jgi:hypothetical protein
MYTITISRTLETPLTSTEVSTPVSIFSQTLEHINLKAVIDAINLPVKPPKRRRSDVGKPRTPKATV